MAKSNSVWGLEIGQSALKALRCSAQGDQVVAEAFDYIEYPKILSQQDAEPEVLVREALQTFVGRNNLKNVRVALSVAGQNGLAKFFKPPPVELKKMADIVKYEARQQIPFDLRDVVWDYQLMPGSKIENGFALESEVGLFAMKRDAVTRALKPLVEADIEIDFLQLAPLSIFNAINYDHNLIAESTASYDSEHPPKSVVIVAMGTDATDLIITNGYRLWQRSMPLGGNHFTRQLTKDLKLTFTKAEQLKRNAMDAEDPKLVFQAMRPVFNDLVTEVQRSIGFFRNLHKKDDVGSILMLGNSVRLPGLSQYLSKTLSMDVAVVDSYRRLSGDEVVASPGFKEHAVTFAPVYGLCLQALGKGGIYTNLVPHELFTQRMVRAKKPWAVAAAATLLLGLAASLLPAGSNYKVVHPDKWSSAVSRVDSTTKASQDAESSDKTLLGRIELLEKIGQEVSGSRDRRLLWLELLSAIDQALDRPADFDPSKIPNPKDSPLNERNIIFITKIENKFVSDLSTYITNTTAMYDTDKETRLSLLGLSQSGAEGAEGSEAPAASATATSAPASGSSETGNSGWVVELQGYHYHNDDRNHSKGYRATRDDLQEYVLKRLVDRLERGSAKLPVLENGNAKLVEFTFAELGVSRPFVIGDGTELLNFQLTNPEYKPPQLSGGASFGGGRGQNSPTGTLPTRGSDDGPAIDDNGNPEWFDAPKFEFTLQFIWREKPLTARLEAKRLAEEAKKAAEEAAQGSQTGDDLAASQ